MIEAFTFAGHAGRAVFGVGSIAKVAEEVQMLGARRALILTSPSHRDVAGRVAADLGELFSGVCHNAVMHVPVETAMETRQLATRLQADCCVTIGGGSAIGLGKAARGDALIEKCLGRTMTRSALECVKKATTAEAVDRCLM